MRSIRILLLAAGSMLAAVSCVTEEPRSGATESAIAAVDPHPYPIPPKHPKLLPGEPCQVCHKVAPYPGEYPPPPPPIPGECAGCHSQRPPNDPHWPNYPRGRKRLPPGPFPLPPYCLQCHWVEPDPIEPRPIDPIPVTDAVN